MVGEEKQDSMVAPSLGAIGSVILLVGAFLTWVTASVDLTKLGKALGIDLSKVPVSQLPQTVVHAAGVKGWEGKLAVAGGIVAIVGVALGLKALKKYAPLLLIGGAAGAFAAIFAASFEKNSAINDASAQFASSGLPGKITDYVSITLGIGLWLCLIAGLLCIAGGAMALVAKAPAAATTATPPMMPGAGFGFASPAPTPPPATPMSAPPPVLPTDPTPGTP